MRNSKKIKKRKKEMGQMREEFDFLLIILGCLLTTFGFIGVGVYYGPIVVAFILGLLPPGIAVIIVLSLGLLILGFVFTKER